MTVLGFLYWKPFYVFNLKRIFFVLEYISSYSSLSDIQTEEVNNYTLKNEQEPNDTQPN